MKRIKLLLALVLVTLFYVIGSHAASITVDVANEKRAVNSGILSAAMAPRTDGQGVWDSGNNGPVPEMMLFAEDMGMKFLRYTTLSNVEDGRDWENAVGQSRTDITFGLPEFLYFCMTTNVIPIIVVPEQRGTSYNAADMVEYLNASSGTNPDANPDDGINIPWADIRDADRANLGLSPGPWNVKWFEYGNESWADMSAQIYVNNYLNYQSTMKSIDPTIKLGAVLGNFFWHAPVADWNAEVIPVTGNVVDFFIIHAYIPAYTENCCKQGDTACLNTQICLSGNCFYPQACSITADNLFTVGLAGVNGQLENYLKELNKLIHDITGRNDIEIAVTEFNGHFVQDSNLPVPYRHSLGDALINAEFIRQFIHADNIVMSNFWNFANEYWGMIKGFSVPYTLRPNFYPFYFYNNYFEKIIVDAQVSSPTYEVVDEGEEYGVSPALDVSQEEKVDPLNIVNGNWSITPVSGASSNEANEILTINFDGTANVDYYHANKTVNVLPDTWYRLSGFIKTDNLGVGEGAYLAVQDIDISNLVTNSGFENNFSDWNLSNNSDSIGTTTALDNSEFFAGPTSAKVTFDGSKDNNYYHVVHTGIDVLPNTTYTLEGFIKTDNIYYSSPNLWNGIKIEAQDGRGYQYGAWAINWGLKGNNDWTHVKREFTTNSDTSQIKVLLRRMSGGGTISGEAWWDNVKLSNKITTKIWNGTSEWRYVYVDFNTSEFNNPTSLAIIAEANVRGDGIQNKQGMFTDIMLQELTPSNNGAVPYLSVNASKSEDGKRVSLMVVNKHMTSDITSGINLNGFNPSSAKAWILNDWTVDDGSTVDATNENRENVYPVEFNLGTVTNSFNYTFPAHSLTALVIYTDADGDGYSSEVDCNDDNAGINPGVLEICDGIDNNCNDVIDDVPYYRDADSDGYGKPSDSLIACDAPLGYVANNSDCLDNNATVNPAASEVCDDGLDNDCDGVEALCSPSGWYGGSGQWQFRGSVSVASGMTTVDLVNFPVLIKITDTEHPVFTEAQADGDDIIFVDSIGLKLDHELEKFNPATGELAAWVRMPVISSIADTEVYMYYGNADALNQESKEGVWDSNYVMIQHLSETSGQHFDSTSNNNDSNSVNVASQGAGGKIGGADEFCSFNSLTNCTNASIAEDSSIVIPDHGVDSPLDLSGNGSISLSAWIYVRGPGENPGNQWGIIDKSLSGMGYTLRGDGHNCTNYGDYTAMGTRSGNWGGTCGTANDISQNSWAYVTYVYDSSTSEHSLYINGSLDVTKVMTTNTSDSTKDLRIGEWGGSSIDGYIDEVRISNTARSAEWIAAEYNNQNNPGNYMQFATSEAFCTDNDHDGYAVEGGECGAADCDDNDPNLHPGGMPVKVAENYYPALQPAYDAATDSAIIEISSAALMEDLNFNLNKTLTLAGGYDCSYLMVNGITTISGNVVISGGKVTMENLEIQ